MTTSTIGLLHPGEMGAAVGAALRQGGNEILWASQDRSDATKARAAEAKLVDVSTVDELVRGSDVVLSICPPHAALDVARLVSGFGGLFIDANAISPARAEEVAAIVTSGGARYVDGGIIGSPPGGGERTRLYLSGDSATDAALLFELADLDVHVLRPMTAASAVKMAYAAWTKGTAALLLAIRALAAETGVEDDLVAEWSAGSAGLVDQASRAASSAARKGWRWIGEMDEIAASFRAAGLPSGFHEAAAEIYRRAPRDEQAPANDAVLRSVIDAINAHDTEGRAS